MDQDEDPGLGRVLLERLQHTGEVVKILLRAVRLDVEDVDKELYRAEDGLPVPLEVGLVERVLPPAVPEVEMEVAQEPDVMMLHVQGG